MGAGIFNPNPPPIAAPERARYHKRRMEFNVNILLGFYPGRYG